MHFEGYVAWRYLRSGRRHPFLSVITLISVGGVAVGVTAMLVTLSVHNGFESDLRKKILGANAHLAIVAPGSLSEAAAMAERLKSVRNIAGVAPVIWVQGLLLWEDSAGNTRTHPVVAKGVVIEQELQATELSTYIKAGSAEALSWDAPLPEQSWHMPQSAILGYGVADQLFRIPEYRQLRGDLAGDAAYGQILGRQIRFLSPELEEGPSGARPRTHRLTIGAVMKSGYWQTDGNTIIIPLPLAAWLKGLFQPELDAIDVDALEIRLTNPDHLTRTRQEITELLCKSADHKHLRIQDWSEIEANLFDAIRIEKVVMFVIIGMVIMVAAFNIMSTLIMTVLRKTREIGILVSMGARRRSIISIFVATGCFIGVVGTFLGAIGGISLCLILDWYGLPLPGEIYTLDHIPVRIEWLDLAVLIPLTLFACGVAGIYPACKAAVLDPVEALRHE